MTWTTQQRSERGGLAVIERGTGPQLLMLHGVGLCADAWGAQQTALSARFAVCAPDLPGHGQSPMASVQPEVASYTDGLARLLDRPTLVVGHSMGAMIALDLAHRYPKHIRGVAALNAVFERSPEAARAVEARAAALDGKTPADPGPTLNRWFGNAITPEREACQRWLSAMAPAAYKGAYTAFATARVPSRETLARLACPALFITGAAEPNSTPEMSGHMARIAPHGRVIIVPDAAHMMPMTHAAEVNGALSKFAEEAFA